ncbi:MFS transporter, partial [Candidatus Collierbacteria bacterium CG10_big_fil_rev_8_21_14_0_10_44_9]
MYELLASMLNGYTTSYRGIPGHCWQRIAISLIEAIVAGVIFFLSLYFVRDLHFSVAVAGLLIACYGVGTAIGGVAGGKLSDRYRPTIVSILGLGIMGVAFLILGHLTNAILLGVCLFLIGFSAYCFVTSNTLWILNYCVDENTRHKSISVTYAILNLGLGAGALLVILLGRNRF